MDASSKLTASTPASGPFIYLLNAMENAASQENPSEHGYAGHRAKVLDYVAGLEAKLLDAKRPE